MKNVLNDDAPASSLRAPIPESARGFDSKRSVSPSTHHAILVGEVAIEAGDGRKRTPFSVASTSGDALIVFSQLGDNQGWVLDRFRAGAHAGVVATFSPDVLLQPTGVAIAEDESLYVVDADRCVVLKCSPTGEVLETLGSEGTDEGQLLGPRDIDIGRDGRIIVADSENHRVQIWSPTGDVLLCLAAEVNEDDESRFLQSGQATGEFFRPLGVTFDSSGRTWVADTNNHRIQRFSADGQFDLAFGIEGTTAGHLQFPIDVRVDHSGRAVIADLGGKRLQWFSPSGQLECAIVALEAIPEHTHVADVAIDDDGDVCIPVGPLARVFRVRRGEAIR